MSLPTYSFSTEGQKNAGLGGRYNDNENPFATAPESPPARPARNMDQTFHDYENPFAFTETAPQVPQRGTGERVSATKFGPSSSRLILLSTIFRIVGFISTLTVILLLVFSKHQISYDDGPVTVTATVKYTYSGSFKFLLYANAIVCAYASVVSVVAVVMRRRGTTTPAQLIWPVIIVGSICSTLLLVAFASALAVEVVSRKGVSAGVFYWEPICKDFGNLCAMIELALAACLFAYLNITADLAIVGYTLHRLTIEGVL